MKIIFELGQVQPGIIELEISDKSDESVSIFGKYQNQTHLMFMKYHVDMIRHFAESISTKLHGISYMDMTHLYQQRIPIYNIFASPSNII